MPSITLQNVEFTLDLDQISQAISGLDAQATSDLLDELAQRHPLGLIVRLARFEPNRQSMAAELAGFDNGNEDEVEVEDDREAFLDKVKEFVDGNGMYDLMDGAELGRDAVEYAVEYREDEVIESLTDAGTIPSFDLDDLKYNVREIARLVSEVENDIGA